MTESDWLSYGSADRLLSALPFRLTERRWRWLACGICRQRPPEPADETLTRSLEDAEAFAEGQLSASRLNRARQKANSCARDLAQQAVRAANSWNRLQDMSLAEEMQERVQSFGQRAGAARLATLACTLPISTFFQPVTGNALEDRLLNEYCRHLINDQPEVVRDVVGNPFHRSAILPDWLAWRDGFIARLALDIHQRRLWDEMPILGDALEDAGCSDRTILEHCHGPGPHVRGCWVVDQILGRLSPRVVRQREVLYPHYNERYCTPLEPIIASATTAGTYRVDVLFESAWQAEAVVLESEVDPAELPEDEQPYFSGAIRSVIQGVAARVANITPHGRAMGGVRLTVLAVRYPSSGDLEAGLREAAGEAVVRAIQDAVMVPLERSM